MLFNLCSYTWLERKQVYKTMNKQIVSDRTVQFLIGVIGHSQKCFHQSPVETHDYSQIGGDLPAWAGLELIVVRDWHRASVLTDGATEIPLWNSSSVLSDVLSVYAVQGFHFKILLNIVISPCPNSRADQPRFRRVGCFSAFFRTSSRKLTRLTLPWNILLSFSSTSVARHTNALSFNVSSFNCRNGLRIWVKPSSRSLFLPLSALLVLMERSSNVPVIRWSSCNVFKPSLFQKHVPVLTNEKSCWVHGEIQ